MNRLTFAGLAFFVMLCTPGFQQAAQQPPEPQEKQQGHVWKDMPLDQVLKMVREKTGKTFLFTDTAFKARTVNFMSNRTLETADEWFAVFESILQLTNYALVKIGDPPNETYKILPSGVQVANAAQMHSDLIVGDEKFKLEDKMIIRLFIVKHVNPQELVIALQSLIPTGGPARVQAIQSARAVMVRDYDYNIAMLEKLVKMIDVELPDLQFEVRRLQHADARAASTMLDTLMKAVTQRAALQPRPGVPAGQQEQINIVPDARTNSLLILAEPLRMPKILELIKEIDSKVSEETSGIFMYTLKNAEAEKVAQTMNSLYSKTGISPTSQPGVPSQPVLPTTGSTPASQNAPIIVSDKSTNSIIVVSERSTYKTLEKVIAQLDRRKPQVLIKATVAEVGSRDSFNLGVELAALDEPGNNPRGFAGTSFGLSRLVDTNNDQIPDLRVPIDATGLTFGIFKDKKGNIPALVQALQTKGLINVISEPEALTNDNEKATLTVKDQRPYTDVNTIATAGSTNVSFKFADAATTLGITPHISEGSYLRLETEVLVQQFGPPLQPLGNNIPPPPVVSRELKTSITVPDGRTIVIGGLVAQDNSDSESGIPYASDIPLLGHLFKKTSQDRNKKTLYLFITPYIIYDEMFGDITQLTKERQKELELLRGEPLKLYVDYKGGPVPSTSFQYKMPVRKKKE